MKINDVLMILAVLIGPIIAVQLTRYLDNRKEKRERKLQVFKTLMATRSYNTSWDHVSALNRIDLEFNKNDKKEREVIDSWKIYLDFLGKGNLPPETWEMKRVDLFVDLLHNMANVLNYDFDKTHIKNSSYAPVAHRNIEQEQKKILAGLIDLLDAKRFIPVAVYDCCKQVKPQDSELK